MNPVISLVLGCIFIATISCVAGSDDLIDDIAWDDDLDPKTLITSGGSFYLGINATTVTYILIGVAGLVALGYVLYALSQSDGETPFQNKDSQSYYDPASDVSADAALQYAAADLQNQAYTSQEYRRKRSAFYEQSKLYFPIQMPEIGLSPVPIIRMLFTIFHEDFMQIDEEICTN